MKRTTGSLLVALVAAAMAIIPTGCQSLKDMTNALTNFKKIQFKLGTVDGFKFNGIDITRFSQPSQIGVGEYARLGVALAQKRLPVEFTLNVLAQNPNTGGGTGTQSIPLFLRRMDWTLLIDDRTTINGTIDRRLEIPGSGQSVTIPFTMQLDLYKFFADRGLDDLLNLAVSVGGAQGSSSRLKLTAKVAVETPIGVIDYPGTLTIVDHAFSNP